jgi:hypothetical protein
MGAIQQEDNGQQDDGGEERRIDDRRRLQLAVVEAHQRPEQRQPQRGSDRLAQQKVIGGMSLFERHHGRRRKDHDQAQGHQRERDDE